MIDLIVSLIAIGLYFRFFWKDYGRGYTEGASSVLRYPFSTLVVSFGTGVPLAGLSAIEIVSGLARLSAGNLGPSALSIAAGTAGLTMTMLAAKWVWDWCTTCLVLDHYLLRYRLPFREVGTIYWTDVQRVTANCLGWFRLETVSGETVWVSDRLTNFRSFTEMLRTNFPRERLDRRSHTILDRSQRESDAR